jgi:probable rRNA maturation factor
MSAQRRLVIEFIVEEGKWRRRKEALSLMRRAAAEAWKAASRKKSARVAILLGSDKRLKELNALFRGKAKPTNVLSFSTPDIASLGDIALAYGVIGREARAQGKTFADHAAHLAAHGVLHLLGFDHESARDAAKMEDLERRVLAGLSISDPYAPRTHIKEAVAKPGKRP